MNKDKIMALAFSFVKYKNNMKSRYRTYHSDYGKYMTDDMFVFNKSERIIEIKKESADKLRNQFSGICFDLAYCACEYLMTKKYITCTMVIPIKRRYISSDDFLLWSAYSDCGKSKEWYWHAVTVYRTRNKKCYVLDITHCNKIYELKEWLNLTAETNQCLVKDFRYDKNMLISGNVSLCRDRSEVYNILLSCDSLLGKPQCNIIAGCDETHIEGDDIIITENITSQNVAEIRAVLDAVSSTRIKALYNINIEALLTISYYNRNHIPPAKKNRFSEHELVMQDIEMYCSPEDVMYAGMLGSMTGLL